MNIQLNSYYLILNTQRLICWSNLQTKVSILDYNDLNVTKKVLLAPGDVYVKIIISTDYQKYAIFNLF